MTAPTADVLVIAPHPDDAEFGVSGTVAKWTSAGKKVVYALCTSGDKGTNDPAVKPEDLAKIREKEQANACNLLGVSEVTFLRYPDQGLEDTIEFRKSLVRLIRQFRPHTVVTADPYRRYIWHRDHRITGQVTLDAVFPYARDFHAFPELQAEGLQPHKVREILLWGSEDPDYFSDITDTFATKIAALRCHQSQMGEETAPRVEGWVMERARLAAQGQDFELAEAFHRVEINR